MDIAFSPDGGTLAYVTHDSCIHFVTVIPAGSAEGVLPTQEKVQTIRLSGLPHRRVLFLSKDAIVAAGHDSNPILYTRSADTWSEHSKLDDSKSKKQGASQSSARSAAFRKFEMAMPQGTGEGDSGPSGTLPTRHQNCITGLSTCPEWGGSQQCTQFTSVGLDGRMCFWTVPAV